MTDYTKDYPNDFVMPVYEQPEHSDASEPPAKKFSDNASRDTPKEFWGMKENTYCMLMHLSALTGFSAIPVAGMVLPVVMWAVNKDKSEVIDRHGKNLVNFLISFIIYLFASFFLIFAAVGFLLIPAVLICGLIFPIMAAVKANDGEYWPYPLCIRFFK